MSASVVYLYRDILRQYLPSLSKPQSLVLAAFCLGMALAQRCNLRPIAEQLHILGTANTVERRLQRFLSGGKLCLSTLQRQLAHWVVSRCVQGRAVLLVDETCLGNHLRVMVVCLAYRGRALPLAWECYLPDQYPAGGQVALVLGLLERIAPALQGVPEVVVEADRGIGCSPRLLEGIARRGWYYLMRVPSSVRLLLEEGREVCFGEQVRRGECWQASGCYAFKKGGWLRCRALGCWRVDAGEAWLLVTNHPQVEAWHYAQRMWQELAFRDLKSGGWQWQRSRVWHPAHAQRLWLVMAVAYALMLWLGEWAQQERQWLRGVQRGAQCRWSLLQLGLRVFGYWMRVGAGWRLLLCCMGCCFV